MSDGSILAAGDGFVAPELFAAALSEQVGDGRAIRELTLPWPLVPFGPVAEVGEASGDEDVVIEALGDAEIAVTHLAPFTERIFAAAPGLRMVAVSRGGPVNVNLEAATRHGVAVTYAPGRNATAVAEFTIGLMIAACRNIGAAHASIVQGGWPTGYFEYSKSGIELSAATVGLVGYGAVGMRVARLLDAFGARVVVYDPHLRKEDVEPTATLLTDLDELLSQSQVVSLHQRATPETRGMIGAAQLGRMPTGSVLVNTGRGSVLDYAALTAALESGHLGGAGLDVFDTEPLPNEARLRSLSNVVLAPHIAGCSRQVAERAAQITAAEVGRFLRGEPLANRANPTVPGEA
ncbi:2-hydroxyacid dehydrogenase [Spiractinospora alimapuensis]|uniref:2-hydroxyacid dehydrogenase n=1 Tax=Spiractinospora alimapuensis TaxID=2820884 RepID=UPI001F213E5C|nr:2-hydroxyacid dehydrogenase [Spiractinospora alimapuensis]